MKRSSSAKKIAVCAMLAALCVAILAVGSVVKVLDLSLALIAGTVVMITGIEFSEGHAWSVFIVSALLSFLLPSKSPTLLYAFFFGWYPLLRGRLAPMKKWLRITLKVVLFNVLTAGLLAASYFLVGTEREPLWITLLTFVLANVLFAVYEPALGHLIRYYKTDLRYRIGFHR